VLVVLFAFYEPYHPTNRLLLFVFTVGKVDEEEDFADTDVGDLLPGM